MNNFAPSTVTVSDTADFVELACFVYFRKFTCRVRSDVSMLRCFDSGHSRRPSDFDDRAAPRKIVPPGGIQGKAGPVSA